MRADSRRKLAEINGRQRAEPFLPDLCSAPHVLTVILTSEILAVVLTLAPVGYEADPWQQLALTSMFVQWIALTTLGILCALRQRLAGMAVGWAATLSLLALLLVTAAVSEAAYRLAELAALPQAPGIWSEYFTLRNVGVSAIIGGLTLRYLYVHHQWRQKLEAEAAARLQALQARIRPHFLFNSLNTIAGLIGGKPRLAQEAIEDLSELFRTSLGESGLAPLDEELALVRRYLHLEQLRLEDRLQVRWDVDGVPRDALIPWLSLQPLVENAVYHGIELRPQGGVLHIVGRLEDDAIRIEVENPFPD